VNAKFGRVVLSVRHAGNEEAIRLALSILTVPYVADL
jgi:hypothetical protein